MKYIFYYDAMGNRVVKENVMNGTKEVYVRDAQGNVITVYEVSKKNNVDSLFTKEFHIFGSNRLGYLMDKKYLDRKTYGRTLGGSVGIPSVPHITFPNPFLLPGSTIITPIYFGNKRYELTDWLGNVRVVVNDKKTPINSGTTTVSYNPQVVSVTDYYSFGSQISERSYEIGNDYRFGFNRHENMNEVSGKGNYLSFGDNGYNTRLGVRWNVEPKFKKYPYWSVYSVFGRNPIRFMDKDGNEIVDPQGRKAVEIVEGKITFTEYATEDIKRVVNAMQVTNTSKTQLMQMISSDIKIKVFISSESKIKKENNKIKYIFGETRQGNLNEKDNYGKYVDKEGKYAIKESKIIIYEGTIKDALNVNMSKFSGLTVEESIAAVASHESVHASDKEEINKDIMYEQKYNVPRPIKDTEKKPRQIENKVIKEIREKKNK